MTPIEAGETLAEALRAVPKIRVSSGLGRGLIPPEVVVGPPTLDLDGFCADGSMTAKWSIYLVASLTEFATHQLLELVGPVVEAIEKETGAIVRSATPGTYPAGQQGDLPSYLIETEWEL